MISLTLFNVLLYVFLDFFLPFRSINTHILRCSSEIDMNAGNWLAIDNNQYIPYTVSIDLFVLFLISKSKRALVCFIKYLFWAWMTGVLLNYLHVRPYPWSTGNVRCSRSENILYFSFSVSDFSIKFEPCFLTPLKQLSEYFFSLHILSLLP